MHKEGIREWNNNVISLIGSCEDSVDMQDWAQTQNRKYNGGKAPKPNIFRFDLENGYECQKNYGVSGKSCILRRASCKMGIDWGDNSFEKRME
jgi:hypothetical protein